MAKNWTPADIPCPACNKAEHAVWVTGEED